MDEARCTIVLHDRTVDLAYFFTGRDTPLLQQSSARELRGRARAPPISSSGQTKDTLLSGYLDRRHDKRADPEG